MASEFAQAIRAMSAMRAAPEPAMSFVASEPEGNAVTIGSAVAAVVDATDPLAAAAAAVPAKVIEPTPELMTVPPTTGMTTVTVEIAPLTMTVPGTTIMVVTVGESLVTVLTTTVVVTPFMVTVRVA